ncbi:F-box/LRR-repeat protein [Cardamine amara subsp. amara]|uniref:F-box/LRR-repeat protein n=1 Tax=Cardamine amara subsp. amara TaxID=228776 RepID=A0ABD1BXX1_CARAN
MDRISGLPDDVIRRIVRFLPANDAARVLLLGARFKNLEFDDKVDFFQGTFTDFVTESLALLGNNTRIRKFSLKSERALESDRISSWLRDVLKRGVIDLELDIDGYGYELPLEIFTSNTVVKMKLGKEIEIKALPKNALLPSLESLILESVRFYARDDNGDCAFQALLLACPVLKELIINEMNWEDWNWSRIVSSKSLQRLTMSRLWFDDFIEDEAHTLSFDTPSLTYFEYCDVVPDAYPIVKFDSLVEAKLDLLVMENRNSNPRNLIEGIRNVKILDLTSPFAFEALYSFREAIPVFKNLHRLSFTNHDNMEVCWRFLPFLLDKTPNLKTLVIKGELHYVGGPAYVCDCLLGYSFLLLCRVEVMEISLGDHRIIEELEQVKHFLGKLPCLELLIVNTPQWTSDNEKLEIIKDLRSFHRALRKCRIEFRWTV